eukprot:TRINITY_DN2274_c0_g1_i1.p1 TRINITY_DN2274_c0_g1~~TRINITY_DN2274_c0_g1_i1.p1  ORF type:complete len:246 (-),score=95.31 TRINITY_DN2274_c0_g1_i1:127-831(-)
MTRSNQQLVIFVSILNLFLFALVVTANEHQRNSDITDKRQKDFRAALSERTAKTKLIQQLLLRKMTNRMTEKFSTKEQKRDPESGVSKLLNRLTAVLKGDSVYGDEEENKLVKMPAHDELDESQVELDETTTMLRVTVDSEEAEESKLKKELKADESRRIEQESEEEIARRELAMKREADGWLKYQEGKRKVKEQEQQMMIQAKKSQEKKTSADTYKRTKEISTEETDLDVFLK